MSGQRLAQATMWQRIGTLLQRVSAAFKERFYGKIRWPGRVCPQWRTGSFDLQNHARLQAPEGTLNYGRRPLSGHPLAARAICDEAHAAVASLILPSRNHST